MKDVFPGIHTWSKFSQEKGWALNGTLIEAVGGHVLIDPPEATEETLRKMDALGKTRLILLANKDHLRAAPFFAKRSHADVRIHALDQPLLDFDDAGTFEDGEELPGGILAIRVPDNKTPGETAFLVHREGGILILGDALIGVPEGELNLLPRREAYRDVDKAREGIRTLLDHDFDAVLVGDGHSPGRGGRKLMDDFLKRA